MNDKDKKSGQGGEKDTASTNHSPSTLHPSYIPKLRFPEFQDAGPWTVVPLKKLANRRTKKNCSGKITRVLTNSAEYGVLDQRDYFEKDIATKGNLENYFVVDEGDFVYNPRISSFAPVGPISRNDIGKGVMSPLYLIFRFSNSETNFYFYYFKSYAWHSYLRKVGSTGARHDRMAISNDDFMAMPLPVPSPDEQQKIADCLSSLDERIELEAKQLEALKAHKKGLMQQLFPLEGETTPRLRFPEFRNAGPWTVKRLGDLIKLVTPPKKLRTRDYLNKGKFPVIDQSKNEICGWTNDEEAVIKEKLPLIIFGDHTCTIKFSTKPFAQGADGIKILTIKSEIDPQYLYQYLLFSPIEQKQYKRHFSILKEKLVYFPSIHLGEQQKIADCLFSLDEWIELQAKKIEALKAHKKGLMQQLFPNVD